MDFNFFKWILAKWNKLNGQNEKPWSTDCGTEKCLRDQCFQSPHFKGGKSEDQGNEVTFLGSHQKAIAEL